MSGWEIALGIVLLVFSVGIVILVLSQQGEQKNSGVITGGSSDTYISKIPVVPSTRSWHVGPECPQRYFRR